MDSAQCAVKCTGELRIGELRTGELTTRLGALHRRARWVALGTGLSAALLALLGTCGLTLAVDLGFGLAAIGRFVAAAAVATAGSVGLALGVLRVLIRRRDEEALALRVEGHFGGMQSLLISALQLGRPGVVGPGASRAMVDMVKRQAVEETTHLNFLSVVRMRGLSRLALAASTAALLAGAYTAWQPEVVGIWGGRLLHPFDPTRVYPTQTQLTMLTGDLAVPVGGFASVAVRATGRVPETGLLRYHQAGGLAGDLLVRADTIDAAVFRVRLGPIGEDTDYWFEVGDARSPRSLVEALPQPRLIDLVLTPRLPPYVSVPDPPPQRIREVQALTGTEIHLRGQTQVPRAPIATGRRRLSGQAGADPAPESALAVERATLILASGPRLPMQVAPDGTITGRFTVRQDDAYQIVLAYDYPPAPPQPSAIRHVGQPPSAGRSRTGEGARATHAITRPETVTVTSDRPIWYPVRAVPDKPPAIKIVEPGPAVDASPVGQVNVKAEITDDYGVAEAHLWYAVRRPPPSGPTEGSEAAESGGVPAQIGDAEAIDRRAFTRVDLAGRFGSRRVTVEYEWLIARTGARPGDRIFYYLSAADGRQERADNDEPAASKGWRNNPNVAESQMYEIAVVSMEEIERQLREKRQGIWNEIYRIYQREKELRGEVDDIRTPGSTTRPAATSRPQEGAPPD